ncbi:sigma-70 family RNA polymerase sigma factor [Clostridium sp. MSJ-4]|uniref:Sigma-70 family RNA polymerase sigma factor n=1 Tax=Clostridium simiarum TaxID=2841506 RepID=A0ABS6F559_9CLOT|nr:sigma-70 family RNA polymerase sigma factor [Clostridium simiarum]MBU5593403.1 sigma-70 family RNA polymerase sigma factor [Clostridium simiarum]
MDIENLVKLAQKDEDNAFYELISLNKEKMYVTAYAYVNNKEDALDIVQESVYKAYTSIKKLKEPKFFNTWITRIVINCSIDLVRKNKKLKISKEEELMINGAYLGDLKEEKIDLREAISCLDEKFKAVVILKYFHQLTLVEVADTLGMPLGTVKTYLNKALKALRIELREVD